MGLELISLMHVISAPADEEESSLLVGGETTSYILQLPAGGQYDVRLAAIVQGREGSPSVVTAHTGAPRSSACHPDAPCFHLRISADWCLFPFYVSQTAATETITPQHVRTLLRVTDVTQDSVRLNWVPVAGATEYILRWTEGRGESGTLPLRTAAPVPHPGPALTISLFPVCPTHAESYPNYKTSNFCPVLVCLPLSPPDLGDRQSVRLPGSSTSYRVTGLRLGHQYRFTIQPMFGSDFGPEDSVEDHTGEEYPFFYLSCSLSSTSHVICTLLFL